MFNNCLGEWDIINVPHIEFFNIAYKRNSFPYPFELRCSSLDSMANEMWVRTLCAPVTEAHKGRYSFCLSLSPATTARGDSDGEGTIRLCSWMHDEHITYVRNQPLFFENLSDLEVVCYRSITKSILTQPGNFTFLWLILAEQLLSDRHHVRKQVSQDK